MNNCWELLRRKVKEGILGWILIHLLPASEITQVSESHLIQDSNMFFGFVSCLFGFLFLTFLSRLQEALYFWMWKMSRYFSWVHTSVKDFLLGKTDIYVSISSIPLKKSAVCCETEVRGESFLHGFFQLQTPKTNLDRSPVQDVKTGQIQAPYKIFIFSYIGGIKQQSKLWEALPFKRQLRNLSRQRSLLYGSVC